MSESKILHPLDQHNTDQVKLQRSPEYINIVANSKSYADKNKNSLVNFINQIGDNRISPEVFKNFSIQLENLAETERTITITAALKKIESIYNKHISEINDAVQQIENNPSAAKKASDLDKYINLLNAYHLLKELEKLYVITRESPGKFPYWCMESYCQCENKLAFAINALTLIGKLPSTGQYGDIKFGEALYPSLFREKDKPQLEFQKRGIKNSANYFLIKKVTKLNKGDTGDNTYLASDGKKLFYVRGVTHYSPNAVLASKIATLVSKKHFASERLLNNHFAASRKLTGYAISATAREIKTEKQEFLKNHIVPGTGIVDETLNYLQEGDPNEENYGFSAKKFEESYLVKIDFDACMLTTPITVDSYDTGMVTKHRERNTEANLYKSSPHVQTDAGYIKEKLQTRLKLSLLPQSLIAALAEKAHRPGIDDVAKNQAIAELTARSVIALQLLTQDLIAQPEPEKATQQLFGEQLEQIDIRIKEITDYAKSHFDAEVAETILSDLKIRADRVRASIQEELAENAIVVKLRDTLLVQAEQLRTRWEQDSTMLADLFKQVDLSENGQKIIALNSLKARLRVAKATTVEINAMVAKLSKELNALEQKSGKVFDKRLTQLIKRYTKNYIDTLTEQKIWITESSNSLTSSAKKLSLKQIKETIEAISAHEQDIEKTVDSFTRIEIEPDLTLSVSEFDVLADVKSAIDPKRPRQIEVLTIEQQTLLIEKQYFEQQIQQQNEKFAELQKTEQTWQLENIAEQEKLASQLKQFSENNNTLTQELMGINKEKKSLKKEKQHIIKTVNATHQALQQENAQLTAAIATLPAAQIEKIFTEMRAAVSNMCGLEGQENSYRHTRKHSGFFKEHFDAPNIRITQINRLLQLTQGNHSAIEWMNRLHTIKNEIEAEFKLFDSELLKKINNLIAIVSRPLVESLPLTAEAQLSDISLLEVDVNSNEDEVSDQRSNDTTTQKKPLNSDVQIIIEQPVELAKQISKPTSMEKAPEIELKQLLEQAGLITSQWEKSSRSLGIILSEMDNLKRSDQRQIALNRADGLMVMLDELSEKMFLLSKELNKKFADLSDTAENAETREEIKKHLAQLNDQTVWFGTSFIDGDVKEKTPLEKIKTIIVEKKLAISKEQQEVQKVMKDFEMEALDEKINPFEQQVTELTQTNEKILLENQKLRAELEQQIQKLDVARKLEQQALNETINFKQKLETELKQLSEENGKLVTQLEQAKAEKAALEQERPKVITDNETLQQKNQQLRTALISPQSSPVQVAVESMQAKIRDMVGTEEAPGTYQNERTKFSFFKQKFATEQCASRVKQIERLRSLADGAHSPFQFMNELHAIRREIKAETNLFDSELLKKIDQVIEGTYIISKQPESSSLLQKNNS